MPYRLIIANRNYSSWSLRPWVLMRSLDIPFDEHVVPFTAASSYEAFQAFSPTGQVPVLQDGPRSIWDSLGITLYLADRHPGVWPDDADARAFAQSAVAEMHSGFRALRTACTMNVGVRVTPKPMSSALRADISRVQALFEAGLSRFGGPWLAGHRFTAVDAFFAPVAFRIRTYGLEVGKGHAWVDRVLAHPAMREWEAAALAETWREEAHEAELANAGTVTADYRAKPR